MLSNIFKKIFGSRNDRLLKQYSATVRRINALEPSIQSLSDEALRAKTDEFRGRLANGETLNDILPEAFAVTREAGLRVMNMRHFDVQLMAGMVLHDGKIAEMRTGEGKTLMATLPAYLNALSGKGVHVITVNDYLASRDAAWMGKIYNFLGLSVGVILSGQHEGKQAAYACDITYGTNNEFGFDYLRDNMVYDITDRVMRPLNFGIVDEVDSILIDEARTPLIISGQANDNPENYVRVNQIIPSLVRVKDDGLDEASEKLMKAGKYKVGPGDFILNEKERTVTLTEAGHEHVEKLLIQIGLLSAGNSLYEPSHQILLHHVFAGLRAHHLFIKDQHYVVQNNQVVIVDEFTGRLMTGRRWSDGLHQAIEAKEGCPLQSENQTLASITFQNFFRLYQKLAGMTGTADTEAFEFQQIYNLETVVMPTHRKMVRQDHPDRIFANTQAKYRAIVEDVKQSHAKGQPVLVGTTSIENSELLSQLFTRENLSHEVLNAKQHAREAVIIAEAGCEGSITIATNMAGRGTDIVLGGNIEKHLEEVKHNPNLSEEQKTAEIARQKQAWEVAHKKVVAAGGLKIIGSERHESRRIDNQLRGRSGRQGDPGESRFYLSLEDSLMRIFAGDRLKWIMSRLNIPEDEPIEHNMVSRSLETAQRRVEQHNFDMRKQLLEYDDVANEQRKIMYKERSDLLEGEDCTEIVRNMIQGIAEEYAREFIPANTLSEQWDLHGLKQRYADNWRVHMDIPQWLEENPNIAEESIFERIIAEAMTHYHNKFAAVPTETLQTFERRMLLSIMDHHWRIHLTTLENLRQGIFLRGLAQKDPKQEFKKEAFLLFEHMLSIIQTEVSRTFMIMEVANQEQVQAEQVTDEVDNIQFNHPSQENFNNPEAQEAENTRAAKVLPLKRDLPKVGRNDPCPCGSGKKYKQCHGKIEA